MQDSPYNTPLGMAFLQAGLKILHIFKKLQENDTAIESFHKNLTSIESCVEFKQ